MKVRMQRLNMVKYADSEARVRELEQQGYRKIPMKKKAAEQGKSKKAGKEAGGENG